jgi:hypothetical protein
LHIDLPRWLAADVLGAATWIALAAGSERAALVHGYPPGAGALAVAAISLVALPGPIRRRRRFRAIHVSGPDRIEVECRDGSMRVASVGAGTRVLGGGLLLDWRRSRACTAGRLACWLTPLDVSRTALRGLSRALQLRAGGPPVA